MNDGKTPDPDAEVERLDHLRQSYWLNRILNTTAERLVDLDRHSLRILTKNAIAYMELMREQHNLFAAELARRAKDALRSHDERYDVPTMLLKQSTPDTLPLGWKPAKLRAAEQSVTKVVQLQP